MVWRDVYKRQVKDTEEKEEGEKKNPRSQMDKPAAPRKPSKVLSLIHISYVLNVLGLSKQVPANVVFFTDGSSRKVSVGLSLIHI